MNRKMFAPGELKLDDQGHIVAAFAQLDVIDADKDVTLAGSMPTKSVPMSAYGHTSWDGALPVGKGVISEQGDWAVFEGDFFMKTTHGRDAFETVKELGELAEYSYGYAVLDSERGSKDGQAVRYLKALDVFEVSPVLKGAGIGTHTMSIKSVVSGTGMTYAEHLSWYVDGLSDLIERTRDRKAFREQEGRDLSAKDRERLDELVSSLLAHIDAISELLPGEEAPKADDRVARAVLVEIERARGMGVPI